VTVAVSGTEQLDEATETLVYRAAQEAVRNIVRHADARAVSLTVARAEPGSAGRRESSLVLRVRDDGCGFETGTSEARSRGSVGLELLSGLASSHGGTLTLDASPGKGTELVLRLPVAPAASVPPPDRAREPHGTVALR
jgi:signal transduction histidine kinase